MRKLKIPILLLANLVLLMAFALLPKLVSQALDMQIEQNPVYSDMQSVELELSAGGSGLSIPEKLAILAHASAADMKPDQMSMTEQEAQEVITAHLTRLDSLGLVGAFEPATYSLVPKLMYDVFDASRNFTIWTVSFVSPAVTLLMDVDDETGTVLCISHHRKESFSMDGVWERNHDFMDALTNFYFSQFGLLEYARELCFTDYREVDGGVSEAHYSFTPMDTEAFQMQFNVDGAGGFQIYFKS